MRRLAATAVLLALAGCGHDEGVVPAGAATVQDRDLSEMSGLVASRTQPGVLWAINDSGSRARLFRLGPDGRALGRVALDGPWLSDPESLSRWFDGRTDWLLVADIGDNDADREDVVVHAVAEPGRDDDTARIAWSLRFRYPDGPRDAEAIAVDARDGSLLVLSKRDHPARLYRVPLPAPPEAPGPGRTDAADGDAPVATAEFIAALPATLEADVNDIALDARGRQLVVLTYRGLHAWHREPGESWGLALARAPRPITLPAMRKAEALALSEDGHRLFVGSEHRPTPLWSTPLAGGPDGSHALQ